jgi:2-succinyl-5-enolpyruvyl-6-hydroxy-3-cyclohexene-1-carboxylate synthase
MPNPNLSFSSALASALADLGIQHVCLSPGSRNTPLIAGFAAEKRIRAWPLLDERSAGFFATGLARATGRPVALVCTSGSAAAEYHPAVVEASQSDVPLIVLTADRPPELRGVGAPQTIDQISLYGSSVRLFIDAPTPTAATTDREAADLAVAAWRAATTDTPGPAHINLPFREPLLSNVASPTPEAIGRPVDDVAAPLDLSHLTGVVSGRNGIIVAGRSNDPEFPQACAELAAATGYPIIADPLSGLRHGSHPLDHVLKAGDALATAGALDHLTPDLVIRFGPVPTSKATWSWLESHPEVEQLLIDVAGRDATSSATSILAVPPKVAAISLAAIVDETAPLEWTSRWQALDSVVAAAITDTSRTAPFPNEPAVARIVMDNAPAGAYVTVGSSMPIRDVDAFGGITSNPIRVFGNRGTNGIDGIVSAALGTAATGQPAIALVGDVSMFHDLNALGTAAQLDLPLTIVVINNDGGGIFHFLPQRDPDVLDPATFEKYLGTPHGTDFVATATALGLEASNVDEATELARLISTGDKPRLIQVRTNRETNVKLHREIAAAVKKAVSGALVE